MNQSELIAKVAAISGESKKATEAVLKASAEANGLDVETLRHSLNVSLTYTPVTREGV